MDVVSVASQLNIFLFARFLHDKNRGCFPALNVDIAVVAASVRCQALKHIT